MVLVVVELIVILLLGSIRLSLFFLFFVLLLHLLRLFSASFGVKSSVILSSCVSSNGVTAFLFTTCSPIFD